MFVNQTQVEADLRYLLLLFSNGNLAKLFCWKKGQNGECKVINFTLVFFGMSSDVPVPADVLVFASDSEF